MVGLSRKRVFPKTKGDSIIGQDRAQKHCDFRFSQIEKKNLKSQFCNYMQLLLFLSDISCSKNVLNVKTKVKKMKLFINQSNSIIIKAVSGKHKIGMGILNQREA